MSSILERGILYKCCRGVEKMQRKTVKQLPDVLWNVGDHLVLLEIKFRQHNIISDIF